MPRADKNAYLGCYREFFGAEWLSMSTQHPVRSLAKRRDWLSSVEVVAFGHALRTALALATPGWRRDVHRRLISDDPGDIAGAALEVMAVAMFQTAGRRVVLPPASQPGFDLGLELEGGQRVRVSCKALIPSFQERQFNERMHEAHGCIVAALGRLLRPGEGLCFVLLPSTGQDRNWTAASTGDFVRWALDSMAQTGRATVSRCGSTLRASYLRPPPRFTFLQDKPSYEFLAIATRADSEQSRLNAKLDEAVAGLKKLRAEEDDGAAHVVLVKVPGSVSFSQAAGHLRTTFSTKGTEHVSEAVLYRTNSAGGPEGDHRFVKHEWCAVSNPRATRPLPLQFGCGGWARLSPLVGGVNEVPPGDPGTRSLAVIGDDTIDLTDKYVFLTGERWQYAEVADHDTIEFPVYADPNIDVRTMIACRADGKVMTIAVDKPPPGGLVLL